MNDLRDYMFRTLGSQQCKQLFKFNHRMEIGQTSGTDKQIMDQSHEVSLDINEIATLMDQLKITKVFSSTCCIYRVPETLRESNEKAYAPRVVSIGPIYHGRENLKAMEDHKITYLQQFLERSKLSVEELINVVKDNETKLRDCYEETIDLNRTDFTTMILLDAVFIITVLLYSYDKKDSRESGSGDHKFFRPWELFDVMWDMCLLENQLPFFILEEFFKRYSNASATLKNRTVIELTSQLLHKIMPEWVKEDKWETIKSSEVLHFVDFIRKCQQPTKQSSEERERADSSAPTATERGPEERETAISSAPTATERGPEEREAAISSAPTATERSCEETEAAISSAPTATERSCEETETAISSAPTATEQGPEERETAISSAPTATELHQSGVKFKHPKRELLSDVRFSNGILEIPQLTIHARTETLFRNLQAFEHCHYMFEDISEKDMFVNDYITFISCLARAPNDVEVLVRNENLKNLLNSDEAVSNLLYKLQQENYVNEDGFLIGVCDELTSHCRRRTHKWKATLKQVYLNNPWTVISVVAATFLLILTFIQSVCSIIQVK